MTGKRFVQTEPSAHNETTADQRVDAEKYLWLVSTLLRRFPHKCGEKEDLYQQGCLGLLKAAARFDPSYGASFQAYAASMIIGEMRMYARISAPVHIPRTDREMRVRLKRAIEMLTAKLAREPTIDELSTLMRIEPTELAMLMEEVSVTSADAETDMGAPLWERFPASENWLDSLELRDLIQQLPDQDQQLLHCRYLEGLSQTETAKRLVMTQIQVSRRERVLKKMLRDEWMHASA